MEIPTTRTESRGSGNTILHFELNREQGILTLTPEGPLQVADFQKLAEAIDPYIEAEGDLNGLLIDAPEFPGWQSFADLVGHFSFIRSHERHIRKIAGVSDSRFLAEMPHIVRHFVQAEVRHFDGDQKAVALAWITGP